MSWTDGETIPFDNDGVVVFVRTHPRLQCIDVYYWDVNRKNNKFIGRYSDDESEWMVRKWIMERHPELGLVYTDYDDEQENEVM